LKKLGRFVLNLLEIYIPLCTFLIMFSVFVLQIFYRYVLNSPLIWVYEATVLGFVWTTLLGACYVRRIHGHVCFDIAYQNRSEKGKIIFRLMGNALVIIGCLIGIFPTYQYLLDMSIEKTPVLRIPFSIGFLPALVFIILIAGHSIYDIVLDVAKFKKKA